MPSISKQDAPVGVDAPPIEIRAAELGDYTVGFETHRLDTDATPLFVGLPEDRCQCTHLGYVLSGKITFHYADHDETYAAGEAYVATPGHTPEIYTGGEVVEFTLTDELAKTAVVVEANMAAMAASQA